MKDREKSKEQSKSLSLRNIVMIVVFMAFIFITAMISLCSSPREFSPRENRYLADRPKVEVNAVLNGEYEKEYENYIDDQFVMRDSFMQLSSYARVWSGMREVNGVYVGKGGYLMENYGVDVFESDTAVGNIEAVSEFTKWLWENNETGNISYSVMLVPTSCQILTDRLPKYATPYDQKKYIDKLSQTLKATTAVRAEVKNAATENSATGNPYIIDVSSVLEEHSDEYIYYKTDHHYTTLGAYYIYREWAETCGIEDVNDISDYTEESVTNDFYGTLDAKTHLSDEGDSITLYYLNNMPDISITYNESADVRNTLYDYSALDKRDKYSVFLGGNNAMLEINTNLYNGKKLLIIKDSYAHSFIPFVVNHFQNIDVIDLRYYNKSIKELITDREYTDILILYNTAGFALDENIYKISN